MQSQIKCFGGRSDLVSGSKHAAALRLQQWLLLSKQASNLQDVFAELTLAN